MGRIMNFPVVLCLCSLLCLWGSARLGVFLRGRTSPIEDGERDEYGTLLRCDFDAPWASDRLQLRDGDQPLRSA